MSKLEILKIQPTRNQWNRFIVIHTDYYNHGSNYRNEEFARQLEILEKELSETGFITLTDKYMIEHWQLLSERNHIIDEDFDDPDNPLNQ